MPYNILSEKSKKKNNLEYHLRLLTLVLYFMSGVTIIGFTLIIPSYFLLEVQKEVFQAGLSLGENELDKEKKKFNDTIKNIDNSIKIVESSIPKTKIPHELIEKITSSMNGGVQLQKLILTVSGASTTISIDGGAKTRDDFLQFVEGIKKTEPFREVNYPVELIAKNKDIKFQITVK